MRDEFDAVLKVYGGAYQLFWVAQPELAYRRVLEVLPHVVLVDDGLGASGLVRAVRQVLATAPGTAVLAVVGEQAMATARQAVLAGARGFVSKPLVPDETWATIYQMLNLGGQQAQREPERAAGAGGAVVVFIGPKGGTGRTMIAVNTSIALQRETGRGVVMVDADFAAPALDVVMNLRDDNDITHLLARAAQLDPDLINGILSTHTSGLRVLLAPPPGQLTKISLPQVQQLVSQLRRMFDWVVVDLGLPMDETAFAFLDSADHIVMTVLPEMVGLRNTRLMIDQLQAHGHPEEKIWLVLNRSTIAAGISRRDIEERLRVRIHDTVPDDQPLVSQSVNRGVPLMMAQERSAVGKAIRKLAHELVLQRGGGHAGTLRRLWRPMQAKP